MVEQGEGKGPELGYIFIGTNTCRHTRFPCGPFQLLEQRGLATPFPFSYRDDPKYKRSTTQIQPILEFFLSATHD